MGKEIIRQALTGSQDYSLSTHIFGIPWEVMIMALACFAIVVFPLVKSNKRNRIWWLIWAEYFVLCYLSTVVFRLPKEFAEIKTELFWGYKNGFHDGTTFPENFLNVIFFIPIGYLSCLLIKKHKIGLTMLFGLGFSLVIELSQYLFKRGAFDIDDLINNVIGTFTGYLLYVVLNIKELNKVTC